MWNVKSYKGPMCVIQSNKKEISEISEKLKRHRNHLLVNNLNKNGSHFFNPIKNVNCFVMLMKWYCFSYYRKQLIVLNILKLWIIVIIYLILYVIHIKWVSNFNDYERYPKQLGKFSQNLPPIAYSTFTFLCFKKNKHKNKNVF